LRISSDLFTSLAAFFSGVGFFSTIGWYYSIDIICRTTVTRVNVS